MNKPAIRRHTSGLPAAGTPRATRRGLLGSARPIGAALLAGCGPGTSVPGAKRAPVVLKFATWNYRPDLVRQSLDIFEQQNPDIKVPDPDTGPCCDAYRQRLNTQFLADEPLDAAYMRDEDVAEWAEAKWIRPLNDMPGAKDLDKDEYPFVHEQAHYKGKRTGTIYYVGPQIFMYNTEHLKKAGIKAVPATHVDLREVALTLKRQGIAEFPLWGIPSEGLLEVAYTASGKKFFDDQLNPLFGKDPLFGRSWSGTTRPTPATGSSAARRERRIPSPTASPRSTGRRSTL